MIGVASVRNFCFSSSLLTAFSGSPFGHSTREVTVRPAGAPREPRVLDITVTPLEGQMTGTHVLLELSDERGERGSASAYYPSRSSLAA